MRNCLTLTVAMFFLTLNILGQKIQVDYMITAPSSIKAQSISFFERELRSLGDTEIVRVNGFYRFSLIVDEVKLADKQVIGYILSSSLSWRNQCLKNIVESYPCYVVESHTIYTSSDIHKLFKEVVTDFDVEQLAELRKRDIFRP